MSCANGQSDYSDYSDYSEYSEKSEKLFLVAMEFGCLVKLGRHTTPLPIPCRRRRLCRQREVKPHIADDTALVCGKVGRRQSFLGNRERFPFFVILLYNNIVDIAL